MGTLYHGDQSVAPSRAERRMSVGALPAVGEIFSTQGKGFAQPLAVS